MIVHAEDNFRRSIETTLDVGVDFESNQNLEGPLQAMVHTFFMLEAATSKINHLDRAFSRMAEKYVLEVLISIDTLLAKWNVLQVSSRNERFDDDA